MVLWKTEGLLCASWCLCMRELMLPSSWCYKLCGSWCFHPVGAGKQRELVLPSSGCYRKHESGCSLQVGACKTEVAASFELVIK